MRFILYAYPQMRGSFSFPQYISANERSLLVYKFRPRVVILNFVRQFDLL